MSRELFKIFTSFLVRDFGIIALLIIQLHSRKKTSGKSKLSIKEDALRNCLLLFTFFSSIGTNWICRGLENVSGWTMFFFVFVFGGHHQALTHTNTHCFSIRKICFFCSSLQIASKFDLCWTDGMIAGARHRTKKESWFKMIFNFYSQQHSTRVLQKQNRPNQQHLDGGININRYFVASWNLWAILIINLQAIWFNCWMEWEQHKAFLISLNWSQLLVMETHCTLGKSIEQESNSFVIN